MRIASIYLPSFPLQAALASAPLTAVAAPIAVIAALGAPVVVACSRAAWGQGVRPGMVASVARTRCSELICLVRDPAGEAELVRALADALLVLTGSIDLGGPVRDVPLRDIPLRDTPLNRALFVEVPAGKRGAAFGARVVEIAASLGLRVRVGIADDRFTAAVAASHGGGAKHRDASEAAVICVPRGGAAVFLAPLPLGLLNLPAEVQHMLEALGVRTLGAFAELPPPSVARAWDADLQALARGDGGTRFDAYRPAARLFDRIDLRSWSQLGASGLGAGLQRLAERLAARLTGRGTARVEVELRLGGAPIGRAIELSGPYDADAIADELVRGLGPDGEERVAAEPATAIELRAVAHDEDETEEAATAAAVEVEPARVAQEEVAPLVLTPSVLGHRPEHRRTRRGKQRPRITPGQARLFSREN